MYPAVRNPVPRELTWRMTDSVIQDFFWLHAGAPLPGQNFNATCRENKLTITTPTNLLNASVLLDSRLINFEQSITIEHNSKTISRKVQPSLRTLCEALQRRGDPELAFTAEVPLPFAASAK